MIVVAIHWPGGFSNVSLNVLSSVDEVGLWFRFHNEGRLGSEAEYHSWCSTGSCWSWCYLFFVASITLVFPFSEWKWGLPRVKKMFFNF